MTEGEISQGKRQALKMQEDCYSAQIGLLFPACIRCLGNTKLIVTAQRGTLFLASLEPIIFLVF